VLPPVVVPPVVVPAPVGLPPVVVPPPVGLPVVPPPVVPPPVVVGGGLPAAATALSDTTAGALQTRPAATPVVAARRKMARR